MKKSMRTIFANFATLFVVLACATFTLTACGDDNEGSTPPPGEADKTGLVGTWQSTNLQDGNIPLIMCFNADYTGWDNFNGEKEAFTWYVDGDELIFVYPDIDGYDQDTYCYAVAGNDLYLYGFDYETGEKELEWHLKRL